MAKGTLTVRLIGDSKPLEKTLKGVGGKLGGFVKAAGAAAAGAAAVVAVKGVQAAREAQEINRITENVIKTTGGAANVTAQQVDDLSGRLQKLTGVSDETIQRGSNMLLTFTNIRNEVGKGNDIFDQATGLALDMSTAMGTDVKDSAIQLGKALNDPIKGVSALSRVGVQFTDQQKDQIETLMESGDTLGAQKVILEELGKQFGGTAEAAADPMKKLMSTIGDVVEVIGTALLPVVDKIATWLADNLPGAVEKAKAWIEDNLVPAFRALSDWWNSNGPAIIAAAQRLWAGIKTVFDNVGRIVQTVIGWFKRNREEVTGSTSGLMADLQKLWGKLQAIVQPAIDAVVAIVSTGLSIITEFWDRFGKHILKFLKTTWDNVMRYIGGALDVIRGIFETFAGLFTGDWSRMWNGIKTIFSGAWRMIKALVGQAFDTLKLAIGAVMAAISQLWGESWERIKGVAGSFVDYFARLPGRMARAASGMFDGLKSAFRGVVNWIIDKWNGLSFSLPSVNVPMLGRVGGFTLSTPNIPRLQYGGEVTKTGLAMVHKGERYSGVDGRYPIGGGGNTYILNFSNYVGDKADLIRTVKAELARDARRGGTLVANIQ